MNMQKIITEKIGQKTIVLLQENLDATDVRLTRQLQHHRQPYQEVHIWVDCSALACLKSLGFCYFINQLLLLKAQDAHIMLLNLSKHDQHLLSLLKLDGLFTLVPNFEEAYQLVQAT